MSWFKNQIRSFLKSESNPSKVIEVKQEKYFNRIPCCREEGIVLYPPGGKDQEYYEIIILRPSSEKDIAFSIYRSRESDEIQSKFDTYKDKLPLLLNLCKDACSTSGLQKICDIVNENPSWSVCHIVIQLNYLDILAKPEIKSQINLPDPKGFYPVHLAIKNSNLAALKDLLKCDASLDVLDLEGNTVHHYAAETNKDIVSLLSSKAPECLNHRNAEGHTPLHVACLKDKRDCVKALLLTGADVNVSSKPVTTTNSRVSSTNIGKIVKEHDGKLHEQDIKSGGTPLHWSGSREVIDLLIQNDCDINAVNFEGRTALHIMVLRERLECAIALLSYGCEVNLEDEDGNTPLHIAVQQKNTALIQALTIFGANLEVRNGRGETPRHIAATYVADLNAQKVLYILHAIGAMRCTTQDYEILQNCTAGCHSAGQDCGIPPPEPKSYPLRPIMTLYETIYQSRNTKGGRLLCLDGGGIRGLVLIIILLHLEEAAEQPIFHCFDWVAGTSTGAILALGLAAGKTLNECLRLYFLMKEKTFVPSKPYPSEPLEKLLKDIFGDLKMSDIKHPKLLMTSLLVDNKPADLHIFRNYTPPSEYAFPESVLHDGFLPLPRPEEQLVWKAARASGAAPGFFRQFERYLDGGLIANNPTLDALTEIHEYNLAMKYVGKADEVYKPSVVVSVGTGCIPVTELKDIDIFRPENLLDGYKLMRGVSTMCHLLVDQATQAEGRVVDRARAWCHTIDLPFYRFCPQLSEDISMDERDDQKLVNMCWETKAYMVQHHTEVLKLVALLKS